MKPIFITLLALLIATSPLAGFAATNGMGTVEQVSSNVSPANKTVVLQQIIDAAISSKNINSISFNSDVVYNVFSQLTNSVNRYSVCNDHKMASSQLIVQAMSAGSGV